MTYKISLTNTGLDTVEKAKKMAEIMQADGHDVEFAGYDCMQGYDDEGDRIVCPVSDSEWDEYLVRADEA